MYAALTIVPVGISTNERSRSVGACSLSIYATTRVISTSRILADNCVSCQRLDVRSRFFFSFDIHTFSLASLSPFFFPTTFISMFRNYRTNCNFSGDQRFATIEGFLAVYKSVRYRRSVGVFDPVVHRFSLEFYGINGSTREIIMLLFFFFLYLFIWVADLYTLGVTEWGMKISGHVVEICVNKVSLDAACLHKKREY